MTLAQILSPTRLVSARHRGGPAGGLPAAQRNSFAPRRRPVPGPVPAPAAAPAAPPPPPVSATPAPTPSPTSPPAAPAGSPLSPPSQPAEAPSGGLQQYIDAALASPDLRPLRRPEGLNAEGEQK